MHTKPTLLAICILSAGYLHGQSYPDFPHIITNGTASQLVENDKAQITVSVRTTSDNSEIAQQKTAETINTITKLVKEDPAVGTLQTVGVQTNPIYANHNRTQPRIVGYEALASLQISTSAATAKVLHAQLAEVQSTLQGSMPAITLNGPDFFLSPERAEETEKALIEDAYKSALSQAEALAKAAGIKIEKPVRLSTSQSHSSPKAMMAGAAMGAMMDAEIAPIETQSGETQIHRSVEAVFSTN